MMQKCVYFLIDAENTETGFDDYQLEITYTVLFLVGKKAFLTLWLGSVNSSRLY